MTEYIGYKQPFHNRSNSPSYTMRTGEPARARIDSFWPGMRPKSNDSHKPASLNSEKALTGKNRTNSQKSVFSQPKSPSPSSPRSRGLASFKQEAKIKVLIDTSLDNSPARNCDSPTLRMWKAEGHHKKESLLSVTSKDGFEFQRMESRQQQYRIRPIQTDQQNTDLTQVGNDTKVVKRPEEPAFKRISLTALKQRESATTARNQQLVVEM